MSGGGERVGSGVESRRSGLVGKSAPGRRNRLVAEWTGPDGLRVTFEDWNDPQPGGDRPRSPWWRFFMPDSPRWCAVCNSYGDHHTDRHPSPADRAIVSPLWRVRAVVNPARLAAKLKRFRRAP